MTAMGSAAPAEIVVTLIAQGKSTRQVAAEWFWLVHIPEIGRSTQALRYKDVPVMAGELVEIMEGWRAETTTCISR
jgi:hypothetical protein